MDYYDTSDILASRARPAVRPTPTVTPPVVPSSFSLFRLSWLAALALIAWLVILQLKVYLNNWQDKHYRLSMRRRHGIPDDDHRPFNVAYAAARQMRLSSGESTPEAQSLPRPRENFRPIRVESTDSLRYRQRPAQAVQSYQSAQRSHLRNDGSTLANDGISYIPKLPARAREVIVDNELVKEPASPPIPQSSRIQTVRFADDREARPSADKVSRKRGLDDEADVEVSKRTRTGGREVIDVDDRMDEDLPQKRGSKRGPSPEEDEGYSSRQEGREKRIRRVSADKNAETEELMDTDDVPRGKKRDRGEAGSTFGGDDYLDLDDLTGSRRRRRRMEKQRSDVQLRGTKRDRDSSTDEELEELLEAAGAPRKDRVAKKQRAKGALAEEEEGDQSLIAYVDDEPVSVDPLCKGRKIGEEWEENGEHYKVGPNGQRLRQALVKKSRTRFPGMPVDSMHPDKRAAWDVFVEKWLSEEEYKEAEARHDLAWQETPAGTPRTLYLDEDGNILDTPGNKSLLWASQFKEESPVKPGSLKQSVAVISNNNNNNGSKGSPFASSQRGAPGRRIASVYATATATQDSTPTEATPTKKTLSKWEKQDLEAAAVQRMRKKEQEIREAEERKKAEEQRKRDEEQRKREEEQRKKEEEQKKVGSAPAQSSASPFAMPKPPTSGESSAPAPPAITFTAPSGDSSKPPASAPAPTPSGPSTVPSFSLPTASGDSSKPTSFSWPPAPAPVDKEKVAASGSASAPSGPAAPSFFSTPPKQPTQAQPAAAPSSGSSIPNFFGPKGTSSTHGVTTPQSNHTADMNASTTPASAPPSQPSFFGNPSNAPAAPSSASPFTFGNTAAPQSSSVFGGAGEQQKKVEGKQPEQAPPPAGGSLLSRLGGFSTPNSGTSQQPSAAPSQGATSIFGNPAPSSQTGAGQTTSIFGAPSSNSSQQATTSSAPAPATEPMKPKFKFETPATRSAAPSPAPTPAGSETPKSGGFTFNFGTSKPATGGAPSASGNATGSVFGSSSAPGGGNSMSTNASTSSVFGQTSAPGAATTAFPSTSSAAPTFGSTTFGAPNSTSQPEAPKSAFSLPSSSSSASQASSSPFTFGGKPAETAKPPQTSSASPFSFPTSSAASSSKPAEPPKASFTFSGLSGATGTGGLPTPSATENKTMFTFSGLSNPSSSNPSGSSPFGTQASGNSATSSNIFGNPSTPSTSQPGSNSGLGSFKFPTAPSSSTFTWPKP
ncbi:hypothetical protein GLOTRDRAFT_135964, partial [Gloeophyllum trabeum ATCC 11539]